jgi:hypothetical protein
MVRKAATQKTNQSFGWLILGGVYAVFVMCLYTVNDPISRQWWWPLLIPASFLIGSLCGIVLERLDRRGWCPTQPQMWVMLYVLVIVFLFGENYHIKGYRE